jgi:hypothetical protein
MKPTTIALLVVLALTAAFIGLFGWQNLPTRVDLVLNLGSIGAWYVAKAFPVPYLMGIMFGSGFLISFVWLGARSMGAGRRAKAAERQVAALQDELNWSKRNGPTTKSAPAPAKRAAPGKIPVASAKSPVAVPKSDKPAASEPPDFDDLI